MLVDDVYIDPMASAVAAQFGLIGAVVQVAASNRGLLIDMVTGSPINMTESKFYKILEPYPDMIEKYKKLKYEQQNFETQKIFIDKVNALYLENNKL